MITTLFYLSAFIAVVCTIMAMTRINAAHGLLNLVTSLLAIAVIFYLIGAPLAGALEVIVYAGAIMVLFVFVIMMLNLGKTREAQERQWLGSIDWWTPIILGSLLLSALLFIMLQAPAVFMSGEITPRQVGIMLYGPYLIAVELSSMLLLAGLVGAYHLGREHHTVYAESSRLPSEQPPETPSSGTKEKPS